MNQIESYLKSVYSSLVTCLEQEIEAIDSRLTQLQTTQVAGTTSRLERTLLEEKDFLEYNIILVDNAQQNLNDWSDYVADINTPLFESRTRLFINEIEFSTEEEFRTIHRYNQRIERIYKSNTITRDLSINRKRFLSRVKNTSRKIRDFERDVRSFLKDASRSNNRGTVQIQAQQVTFQ